VRSRFEIRVYFADANRATAGLLAAGDGSEDDEGFATFEDGHGEFGVGGLVREVFVAGEEAQEGTTEAGLLVADGAAEHGVLEFEGVEEGSLGYGFVDCDFSKAGDVCEVAEVGGEFELDSVLGHFR